MSATNHLAHKKPDPTRLKKRIERDGKLSFREANKWYRYGNGESLSIDASKIDLNFLRSDEWIVNGEIKSVQTLLISKDGLVYGNLSVEYMGNNRFKVYNDNYGFEMHSGAKSIPRNIATVLGKMYAGKGVPYDIEFYNRINTVDPTANRFLIPR